MSLQDQLNRRKLLARPVPRAAQRLQELQRQFAEEVARWERTWVCDEALTASVRLRSTEELDYGYGANIADRQVFAVMRVHFDGRFEELTTAQLEWLLGKRRAFERWCSNELGELPPSTEARP